MATDQLARSTGIWAPIITPKRGRPWVFWSALRGTRRDARSAFLANYRPERRADALKGVRFARVTVTEDAPPAAAGGQGDKP